MCKVMCNSCPFNYTEEAMMVQNYGCLASKEYILEVKDTTGNNWACHNNNKRVCGGLAQNRDISTGKLHLQPGDNSAFISWDEEDLKPILK